MSNNFTARVIRVDPKLRTFSFVALKGNRNGFAQAIRRSLRCHTLGHRLLCKIDDRRLIGERRDETNKIVTYDAGPSQLYAAANAIAVDGEPGWRLRGGETTAGPSILFGQGVGGGMVDVPVDLDWLRHQLVWTDPVETLGDPA